MDYMKGSNMKWYTMPHGSDAAKALKKKYEIRGIPALIIVSKKEKLLPKTAEEMLPRTHPVP